MEIKKFLIKDDWKTSKEIAEILNPYTGKVTSKVYYAQKDDFEDAIVESQKAFAITKKLSRFKRSEILRNLSILVEKRKDDFVDLIVREAGKPITYAQIEVDRSIATLKIASEEILRFGGEYLPIDITESTEGYNSITSRFPLGVIAGISPFNFPLNLALHKIAPAIATGNTIILKPPHQAPSACLLLAQLALEAGFIAGSFMVLPSSPKQADILVTDPRIKMLSFTGSAKVGWDMKKRCGKKKICLELGGNAAVIVHHDANLDFAIPRIALGGYSYAGQICISIQRIMVEKSIYQDFAKKFIDYIKNKIISGDPINPKTVVGPLINEDALARTEKWVNKAVKEGANILIGGKRQAQMFESTVLENVNPKSDILNQEVFAPVTILIPYNNFEEAVSIVNDSDYGLQSGVFTKDIKNIFYANDNLDVGGVIINDYPTFRVDNMPYGGAKDSGFGREGIKYAMEDMTEIKVMVLNMNNL
ncbi:MAG: aldehyde dehydrogenase family protein [Candidatus Sericytochromatia bacterium]|nr:aldehyde dehydrogenase family protein [Candidatus Sericytochromatia bacterium]